MFTALRSSVANYFFPEAVLAAPQPPQAHAAREEPPPATDHARAGRQSPCSVVGAWLGVAAVAMLRTLLAHGTAQAAACGVRALAWQSAKESESGDAMRNVMLIGTTVSLAATLWQAERASRLYNDSRAEPMGGCSRLALTLTPVAMEAGGLAAAWYLSDENKQFEYISKMALIEAARLGNVIIRDLINQLFAGATPELRIENADETDLSPEQLSALNSSRVLGAWLSYTAASVARSVLLTPAITDSFAKYLPGEGEPWDLRDYFIDAAPAYLTSLLLEEYDELSQIGFQACAAWLQGLRVRLKAGTCDRIFKNIRDLSATWARAADHTALRGPMNAGLDLFTGVGMDYKAGTWAKAWIDASAGFWNGLTAPRGFLVTTWREERSTMKLAQRTTRVLEGVDASGQAMLRLAARVKAQRATLNQIAPAELQRMFIEEQRAMATPVRERTRDHARFEVAYVAEDNALVVRLREDSDRIEPFQFMTPAKPGDGKRARSESAEPDDSEGLTLRTYVHDLA